MMERHDHNNPWADKLQDIRLPGQEVSWEAMEAVLDREMPVNRKDRRRWLLVIILLLLVIGVCNCPGRRLAGDRVNAGGSTDRMSRSDGANRPEVVRDTVNGKRARGNLEEEKKILDDWEIEKKGPDNRETEKKVLDDRATRKKATDSKESEKKVVRDTSNESDRGPRDGAASKGGRRGAVGDTTLAGGPGLVGDTALADGPAGKPRLGGKRRNDSTTTAVRKPKADSILQMKGWLAGAGLNQFFTMGGQEKSDYNSNGTTGGIGDYIPVPMVRYYFSRKLYVQLEAQFNTPQYTTKNLLASQSKPDLVTLPGRVLQTSLYIQKLFYFNLPLSVHYSPIPNLYIGGGIQYARLTNGVALYQDSSHSIFLGGRDSLRSSKIMSFRNDTTFRKLKTNEFRLLLDLNYNFKRFVIGARYNRALSDFINLQISNTQVTQSRNSSFQVYLRYIIWDGRKKT